MKRYIVFISFILVFSFSLMACSNENEEEDEGEEEVMTAPELDGKSTSDPLEVAKDDSYEVFDAGSSDLEIIGRYVSDESDENGMVELEKNGYKVTFALVLVHDPVVDEDTIYVMGERENTNSGGGNMGIPGRGTEGRVHRPDTLLKTRYEPWPNTLFGKVSGTRDLTPRPSDLFPLMIQNDYFPLSSRYKYPYMTL